MKNFQIISETDPVHKKSLIAVIYGEPGVGKTSLSFTAKNPILFDFDGGLHRAEGRKTSVRIMEWEAVNAALRSKDFAELNPETIVIDTAGTMLDNFIADYVKKINSKNSRSGGELSQQGYGAMKNTFKQFVSWAQKQEKNIIFIAHSEESRRGDDIQFRPELTGGSYNILRQAADLIGYMYASSSGLAIDFRPSSAHIGKDCAEIGRIPVPHYSAIEYKTFLQDLIDRTLGKINSLSEAQVELNKMIEEYKEDISKLNTAEEANDQIKLLAEYDRKTRVMMFRALQEYCEQMGIGYNAKEKKFVS